MDHPIDELVGRLLGSYEQCGGIKHLQGANLPSKNAVAALTHDLLKIVFPGFIAEDELNARNLVKDTTALVIDVQQRLEREIAKSLESRPVAGQTAQGLAVDFLRQLPDLRCIIQTDVDAAFQGDPAAFDHAEVVLAYPGIEAVAVFRLAHVLHVMAVPYLPRMMTEWAHSRTGIDLHPGATIGSHFFIDHGTGVVIGGTSRIGDRVRLYQGVGLVARSLAKQVERNDGGLVDSAQRHPTIGNDVTIYANATIVGGDTRIGDRTIVGGNVWLTRSVPADSVVVFEAQQLSIHPRQRLAGDWII